MNAFYGLDDLDIRGLRVLVSVLDEGSVSRAAERLGVTQPAVSHALEKLRHQLGDALFVRDGRGIVPTNRTLELESEVRDILDRVRALNVPTAFDPSDSRMSLTIAANDFQRDLLLPALHRRLREALADLTLDIVPSGMPTPDILAKGHADLLITPHPPDGAQMYQRQLLVDRQVCFFDPAIRRAPRTRAAYLAARHITLTFGPGEHARLDSHLREQGVNRKIELRVSNFSAIPPFLRGTDLVATLPSLLKLGPMQDFSSCVAPVDTGPFAMYAVWHRRVHQDPAHRWLRDELYACANALRGVASNVRKKKG